MDVTAGSQTRSRRAGIVLLVIGVLVLILAAVVAVYPHRPDQENYPSCGSALLPASPEFNSGNLTWDSLDTGLFQYQCAAALKQPRIVSIVIAIVAVLAIIIGAVVLSRGAGSRAAASSSETLPVRLAQLSTLHAQGVLSDDEYAAAKRRILNE